MGGYAPFTCTTLPGDRGSLLVNQGQVTAMTFQEYRRCCQIISAIAYSLRSLFKPSSLVRPFVISFGFYKVKQAASFPSGCKADTAFIQSLVPRCTSLSRVQISCSKPERYSNHSNQMLYCCYFENTGLHIANNKNQYVVITVLRKVSNIFIIPKGHIVVFHQLIGMIPYWFLGENKKKNQ